jgi:hypothetical protein
VIIAAGIEEIIIDPNARPLEHALPDRDQHLDGRGRRCRTRATT